MSQPRKTRTPRKPRADRPDFYTELTERTIAAMERDGLAPWLKPWTGAGCSGMPENASTGRRYSGCNVLSLMLGSWDCGYQSPQWLTFKQAKELAVKEARANGREIEARTRKGKSGFESTTYFEAGELFRGGVRKGEKGTPIVFFRNVERKKAVEGKDDKYRMMKTTAAFNVAQCDGLPPAMYPAPPADAPVKTDADSPEAAALFAAWSEIVPVAHGGNRAYYSPTEDRIQLPNVADFNGWAEYYSAAFHEAAHSTGHTCRLSRDFDRVRIFGNHDYSREELVAEFAACFLTAAVGVARTASLDNSAAYLKGWASKLREDPKLLPAAASAAQKAADFILAAGEAAGDTEAAA